MYSRLDGAPQTQMNQSQFTAQYANAAQMATLRDVSVSRVGQPRSDVVPVTMLARTAIFGTLRQTLLVSVDVKGSNPTVSFSNTLLFPGLEPGEQLSHEVSLPPRATLLAGNGAPLAQ